MVLQLLQIVTGLMSAEQNISASLVYPLVTKLVTHDLAECTDDLLTIADFKRDLCAALDDRFALNKADTALHLFVAATVFDLAMKQCGSYFHSHCEMQRMITYVS